VQNNPGDPQLADRRALLNRILASPQFAHAYSLRRILEYLVKRALEPAASAPKEYDIAVEAIGRQESFDPKTDPIIRVSISGIRERLKTYFENEGRDERLRLTIPKGQYRVLFEKEGQEARAGTQRSGVRERFWAPYLNSRSPNILVYTEVLFFRDTQGNYVRNIFVNDRLSGAEALPARGLNVEPATLRPSFHFVSAGEMHSLLSIQRSFNELRLPLDIRNSRFFSWQEMQGANLILLGSSRTNPFLHSLQGKEPLLITHDSIVNTEPRADEPSSYQGSHFFEGELERGIEYALVTRRPGIEPNSSITLIAGNHGRAIEGAGQFLGREDRLATLLEAMELGPLDDVPRHFQALLRVDLIDYVEEVVHVELVSHRVVG
jgi:hypothetical protein